MLVGLRGDLCIFKRFFHPVVFLQELGDLDCSLGSLQGVQLLTLEVVLEYVEGLDEVLQAVVFLL